MERLRSGQADMLVTPIPLTAALKAETERIRAESSHILMGRTVPILA